MESRVKLTAARASDSVTGNSCPICLNRLHIRSSAVIIPCAHAYCVPCIRRWSSVRRKCPLCNASFTSWFRNQGRKFFHEEKLLIPPPANDSLRRRRRAQFFEQRRLIRRSREVAGLRAPSRELPRRRSFGFDSRERPNDIAERIRRWRMSVYENGLRAVPSPSKNGLMQQILVNNGAKERLRRRIEPWIHRELQAILGDPDPTIIVHAVTSLFISRHEKAHEKFPVQTGFEDDSLRTLRAFLHDKTEAFWHELRCFAESSYSMETYDTVVEYRGVD